MKKSLNFLALAAAATVLLSLPSAAKAQVTIRGPHGSFSIGGGVPFLPQVGAYVPSPYDEDVYETDDGYGFYYNSEWIPCTRYGSRWIIVEPGYGYGRGYAYGRGGYGYARPYSNQGRVYGFEGRRGFEGQREFQGQGRSQIQGRREFQSQGRSQIQGRREFQSPGRSQIQGRQDRGSRGNGNSRSNRDSRRGSDRRW
jgi:hypothetical protein